MTYDFFNYIDTSNAGIKVCDLDVNYNYSFLNKTTLKQCKELGFESIIGICECQYESRKQHLVLNYKGKLYRFVVFSKIKETRFAPLENFDNKLASKNYYLSMIFSKYFENEEYDKLDSLLRKLKAKIYFINKVGNYILITHCQELVLYVFKNDFNYLS